MRIAQISRHAGGFSTGDITITGLGWMGAALAQTLHKNGQKIEVWNRFEIRLIPFRDLGFPSHKEANVAIPASHITLV